MLAGVICLRVSRRCGQNFASLFIPVPARGSHRHHLRRITNTRGVSHAVLLGSKTTSTRLCSPRTRESTNHTFRANFKDRERNDNAAQIQSLTSGSNRERPAQARINIKHAKAHLHNTKGVPLHHLLHRMRTLGYVDIFPETRRVFHTTSLQNVTDVHREH